MWAMRWRAQLAQQRRAALSAQPTEQVELACSPAGGLLLVISPTKAAAQRLQQEDLLAELDSVRTVDLYEDDCDVHVHGSPAPQLAAAITAAPVADAEEQAAAEEAAESLPTPNTANLLNRLQQPRSFKASSWQPTSRSTTTGAEDAQAVVAQQAEQQRTAAADAAQKRAAKRGQTTGSGALGSRSRALLESRQSCEVYSASSKRWLAGSVIATDEVLPNTIKVEYKSDTGSTMQKLLPAGSPHLRKVAPRTRASSGEDSENVAPEKALGGHLPQQKKVFGGVTQANSVAVKSTPGKSMREQRGPRNWRRPAELAA